MKRATPKATLKLIAATSVAIFSLAAVFTATSAWFQSRRELDNGGDNFQVRNLNGHLSSVSFHQLATKQTDSNGDPLSFTFNSAAVGTITYDWDNNIGEYVPISQGNARIALNQYDPMNRSQPLLLMFHLDQAYTTKGPDIRINGLTNASGFLGERDATSHDPVYSDLLDSDIIISQTEGSTLDESSQTTARHINYYWLSSVVQFHTLTFANDTLSWQYAMTSDYADENSLPLLTPSPDKFVSVDNDREESTFHSAPNLFASGNGTIKNIAMVIDYYPDAIEYIYSTYLANAVLEDNYDGILNFLCDWSLEVI